MARDVDGVYELPAGNPVISDTVIESDWANTTLADVKNALTDSLSRTGRGNMEAQFKAAAGSAAEPSVSFINSPVAGMNYSSADNTLTFSINGAAIFTVKADAVVMNESCVLSEDATANMQAVTKQQMEADFTNRLGGYGTDGKVQKYGLDLNELVTCGVYNSPYQPAAELNWPTGMGNYGYIDVVAEGSSIVYQTVRRLNVSSKEWWRVTTNGGSTWGDWDEIGADEVLKSGDFMSGGLTLQYEDPQFALIPLTDGAHLIFSSDSNADASRIAHNYGAESSIDFSTSFIELTAQAVLDGEIRLSAKHVLLWQDATQPMGAVTKQQMDAAIAAAIAAIP